MRRILGILAICVMSVALSGAQAFGQSRPNAQKTDAEIKQILIQESIAKYSGSCPCPYSRDRAGKSCGKRSAYSKPGGASPLCYPEDVPQKLVDDYRKRSRTTED